MYEFFANPANMTIGGLLISSPIIIHLINRMRFKRVRWAAMEFLLKSQKQNRRKLIIEQLILLLLRILLVLLAALLLARFLSASLMTYESTNAVHVILLDDRLSMNDQWKDKSAGIKNSFQVGKELIEKEIAQNALKNRTAQQLVLRTLSDPTTDLFDRRLSTESIKDLSDVLSRQTEATKLHLDLLQGLKETQNIFERHARDQRSLYIVSDFRQRHWFEPVQSDLIQYLRDLNKAGVKVFLVDTADPKRVPNQPKPLHHDNLALVELRPETRVASQFAPVQFQVGVINYGTSERKNVRVTVKVNGSEKAESSLTILSVPPGSSPTRATFLASFDQLGYNQITATLENDDYGLAADNVRFAVIEVRKQVPVLVIDGDPGSKDRAGGDSYFLQALFNAARGFEIFPGSVNELEKPNLDRYASIYLLNVPKLTSEKQLQNLEDYVRRGGGVAFFLGDRITSTEYYNKHLYNDGNGIFPAPLTDQPSRALTEQEKMDKLARNLSLPAADQEFQVILRDNFKSHPILKEVFNDPKGNVLETFKGVYIDRYFPVARQKWNLPSGRVVEELMTLPNDRPITDYDFSTQQLLKKLPVEEEKYAAYHGPGLKRHAVLIRARLNERSLSALAAAIYNLLHDKGQAKNAEQPDLEEFWKLPDPAIVKLHNDFEKFYKTIQFGDPLMLAGQVGKGRTVAMLTTAGTKWNNFAGGGPGMVSFPVIMLEMQKHLSSLANEPDLTLAEKKTFEMESSRYLPEIRVYFQPEIKVIDPKKPPVAVSTTDEPTKEAGVVLFDKQSLSEAEKRFHYDFARSRQPGIYYFAVSRRPTENSEAKVETHAFAFNVDTANESDLRRADRNELEKDKVAAVFVPESTLGETVHVQRSDFSETWWFYVVFLVVLVLEQAMAVHLSFHLHGNEALAPPQAVRPQPTTI